MEWELFTFWLFRDTCFMWGSSVSLSAHICFISWSCCLHGCRKAYIKLIISTVLRSFRIQFTLQVNCKLSVILGERIMGFHGHIFTFLTENNVDTGKSKWSWRVCLYLIYIPTLTRPVWPFFILPDFFWSCVLSRSISISVTSDFWIHCCHSKWTQTAYFTCCYIVLCLLAWSD